MISNGLQPIFDIYFVPDFQCLGRSRSQAVFMAPRQVFVVGNVVEPFELPGEKFRLSVVKVDN